MTNNYSDELGAVKSDLNTLKADIAKLTKSVANDAQNNAAALSDKAKIKMKSASKRTKEASIEGKHKVHRTVATNPFTSIALTAGVALVVGALVARK